MHEAVLQLSSNAHNIFLNTIMVSIPEYFFLLMFTLIITGEFDYWKEPECLRLINPWDYTRVFVPTTCAALLYNMLYYGGMHHTLSAVVSAVVFYILVVGTNDIFGDASALKWMVRVFASMLLGLLLLYLTDLLYIPLILQASHLQMSDIGGSVLLNFGTSLPSRLLQYLILAVLILRYRTILKGNILGVVFSSRTLTAVSISLLLFDLAFMLAMDKAIVYYGILQGLPLGFRFSIILCVSVFPLLNISALIWCVYHAENTHTMIVFHVSHRLREMSADVSSCGTGGMYENPNWKLNEISMELEEISHELYNGGATDKNCAQASRNTAISPNNFPGNTK